MSTNDGFQGVSNCYVFKSRLQEYAQKVGLPTPVYETIKEGPSHEPSFRSTVIVNDIRYDSMPGFFNRKAAEQSAAEVALVELSNTGETTDCISQPVHETGLCKNLLQEYAQKMNYAIPSYECRKDETPGRVPLFSCTVEIGGIKYIGAAARTKKEAEIKAARTSLLAIQSSPSGSYEKDTGNSMYTVIPCKKKATDSGISTQETATLLKPKKGRFKKKPRKKRRAGEKDNHIQVESMDKLEVNIDGHEGQQLDQADSSGVQAANSGLLTMESARNFQDQTPRFDGNEGDKSSAEGALVPYHNGDAKDGQLTALDFYPIDLGPPNHGISSIFNGDGLTSLVSEVNTIPGIGQVASMVNSSSVCQEEVQRVTDGLNQTRQVEAVPGQAKGASLAD